MDHKEADRAASFSRRAGQAGYLCGHGVCPGGGGAVATGSGKRQAKRMLQLFVLFHVVHVRTAQVHHRA
eukprot:2438519-Pyramimonas_sp.AAC.1